MAKRKPTPVEIRAAKMRVASERERGLTPDPRLVRLSQMRGEWPTESTEKERPAPTSAKDQAISRLTSAIQAGALYERHYEAQPGDEPGAGKSVSYVQLLDPEELPEPKPRYRVVEVVQGPAQLRHPEDRVIDLSEEGWKKKAEGAAEGTPKGRRR